MQFGPLQGFAFLQLHAMTGTSLAYLPCGPFARLDCRVLATVSGYDEEDG
jgi:hypothetical protein